MDDCSEETITEVFIRYTGRVSRETDGGHDSSKPKNYQLTDDLY